MTLYKKALCACAVSLVLTSCGGGSSSTTPITTDGNNTDVTGDHEGSDEVNSGDNVTSVETEQPEVSNPTILATDDVKTGGYIGGTTSVRNVVTIPDDITGHLWGIAIRENSNDPDVSARFGSFTDARAFYEYVTDYNRPLDSCHSTFVSLISGFGDEFDPTLRSLPLLSAGDALPLLGPSGSVGEMVRGLYRYSTDSSYTGTGSQAAAPYELSLSIPGDEFPAFETATFPMADPLVGFRASNMPEGTAFSHLRYDFNPTDSTTLVWDSSDASDSFLHIEFFADFQETAATDYDSVGLICTLEDDGEFTFPQAVLDLYPVDPSNVELTAVSRVSVKEVTQPGATLLLLNYQKAN